ncbi:putative secreted/membrane protein [Bacillus phage vB_BspM_Internexus]|nr:putative secreted/membrane protein [Bacillus phage vB_BspM_Internexus]
MSPSFFIGGISMELLIALIVLLNLFVILFFAKFMIKIVGTLDKSKGLNSINGNIEKKLANKDFESDTKYLMFLVDYFCNKSRDLKLIPYQRRSTSLSLLNDDILIKITAETTHSVMQQLSEPYKESLSVYIRDLTDFVTVLVYNRIAEITVELNRTTIKKVK